MLDTGQHTTPQLSAGNLLDVKRLLRVNLIALQLTGDPGSNLESWYDASINSVADIKSFGQGEGDC